MDARKPEKIDSLPKVGVNLRTLKPDTIVFLETNLYLYEMKIVDPLTGLVEISGTVEGLKQPGLGRFVASVDPIDPQIRWDGWIGPNLLMEIRFRSGNYLSGPVIAASLRGKDLKGSGWSYDVFKAPDVPVMG